MATIPRNRCIHVRLLVSRADGITWVDLTSYLRRAAVSLGDVRAVGTGSPGVDAAVRTLQFTLRNGVDSFSPQDKTSVWNQDAKGYAPLLWPTREVVLQVAIESPGKETSGTTYRVGEVLGAVSSASPTVTLSRRPIKDGTVAVYLNGIVQPESAYVVDYATGTIRFTGLGSASQAATADYTWWSTLFHGYLGDSIPVEKFAVSCEARDPAKLLQDTYIEQKRSYGSADGVPAEMVIQSILDDNLGLGVAALYCPRSPGFMIQPYELGYKSVWDAIQEIAQQIGWWLGYRWDHTAGAMQLTLVEPPRNKSAATADWTLDWEDDIYTHGLDVSDENIRNVVTVTYRDGETGKRTAVTVTDAISIAEYGRRAMGIEEDDTSLIDTQDEAQAFAEAALADLSEMTGTSQVEMPLMPELDVFDGLVVTNPLISSESEFYGVESVEHTLDFGSAPARLRTTVVCCGRIIGSHRRWLRMQTRPGGRGEPMPPYEPDTVAPAIPTGLAATASAETQSDGRLMAWIDLAWGAVADTDLRQFHIQRKAPDREWEPLGIVTGTPGVAGGYRDGGLIVGATYAYRVASADAAGNRSEWSAPASATIPGDTTPPPKPTGLAGQFRHGDAIYSWDPCQAADYRRSKIEIVTSGAVKRTAYTSDNGYTYALEMNQTDHTTPALTVEIRVSHEDYSGNASEHTALEITHTPPVAPSQPTVTPMFAALWIEITPLASDEVVGYYVHITPSDGEGAPLDGAVTAKFRVGRVTTYAYQASPNSRFLVEVSAFDALCEGPKCAAVEAATLYLGVDALEPGSIKSEHIAIGAITEAQTNWKTHLMF